jgi:hypothetical protein
VLFLFVFYSWFTEPFSLQKPLPTGNAGKPVETGKNRPVWPIQINLNLNRFTGEKPAKNRSKSSVNREINQVLLFFTGKMNFFDKIYL